MTRADQVTEPCTSHGEGPFWDAPQDRLLLVDMLAGAVVSLAPDGTLGRRTLSGVAAALRARSRGGYVLATERGFLLLDRDLRVEEELPPVFDDPAIRMNDGGCDPQGRFCIGTMAYAETPGAGTLYRLDADRQVSVVLTDVTISNGLQWTRDGTAALYVDTPTGRIDRFDVDPGGGTFSGRRTFAEVAGPGMPDGLAIDEEDGVWVALWGGSAVHRYDANGGLDLVIDLPVSQVTACTFGGPDLRTLFITTSQQGVEPGTQPEAGAVYAYEAGVRGAVPHAYAG